MVERIYSEHTASITELKKNPMGTVDSGEGNSVAILNRNYPVFYCVPAKTYEKMIETLENMELLAIAKDRESQTAFPISLDDL